MKLRLLVSAASVPLLAIAASAQAPTAQAPAQGQTPAPIANQGPTSAPVAYMVDLSSGAVLFERDADRRMPPASMAKMMTTHVAFDLIDKGELQLNRMCTVRPETWQRWHGPQAGSTMFLSAGEQVSVENLLHGIVTLSGNDASVVLAECISGTEAGFVDLMNRQSQALGLRNSHWGNPVGWPDGGVTYTTARDLATLASSTIRNHPQLYRRFYGQESFTWGRTMGSGQAITQGNRNPLLGRVAGADGLKTGHTEEAGYGFTGSAEQNGRRLIMVIAGLDSFNGRAAEAVRFMDWGFRSWQTRPLFQQGARVGEAQVQLGSSDTVGLVAPRNLAATLPAGLGRNLRASIVYDGPVKAPIAQGQHIANLVVQADGVPTMTMPLVAEAAVEEAGFFGRMWAGIKHILGMG
ncbi:MAG: D-alanyl-D-alanine carboxypeptidase family protein [Allosphingosinicella sp.]|uniref:D-alanyl-D-alanine carboxypeptidase family protein n=1 Tax=Allosphingosinicella sp. TaxID=2823234 RepID=UPI003937A97F